MAFQQLVEFGPVGVLQGPPEQVKQHLFQNLFTICINIAV